MKPALKKEVEGKLHEFEGAGKEQVGKLIGSPTLAREGREERSEGESQTGAVNADKAEERLHECATVFSTIMDAPDKGIPQELLDHAHCIVIVPALKTAAFVFGAKYGRGFMFFRKPNGIGWSAPGAVRIEGGSFGFQMGGSETDLVMLVMNEQGAKRLLSSEFTLGAEGSVAAGPVGRTAAAHIDSHVSAEILSWSRTQGLFMGFAVEGATLRQDLDDNAALYGKEVHNRDIVHGEVDPPAAAARLITLLNRYSQVKAGSRIEEPMEAPTTVRAAPHVRATRKKASHAKKPAARKTGARHSAKRASGLKVARKAS